MIVPAADVGVYGKIRRPSLESEVVDAKVLARFLLEGDAVPHSCLPVPVVHDHAPGAVVELDVPAACLVQVLQHRAIGCGEVLDELILIGVDRLCDRRVILAVELRKRLGRCRDRLLCHRVFVLELLHKQEVLHERVVLTGDLPGAAGSAVGRLLPVEEIAMGELHMVNSLKPPHEIQMPVGSPELAVGNHVVPGFLLLFDQLRDQAVLGLSQFIVGDMPLLVLLPGSL